VNGRKARAQRREERAQSPSARALQLIEQARQVRNERVMAAQREFHHAVRQADALFRRERAAANQQMRERIAAIERGDRDGILVAQRIEEP